MHKDLARIFHHLSTAGSRWSTREALSRLATKCGKKYALAALLLILLPQLAGAEKQPLPPLHHVVGIPVPEKMQLPEAFKLDEKGRLNCQTCHGLKDIEETPLEQVDRDDEHFFRAGPYRKLSDFCYQCHDQKAYKRPNIHQQIDQQGGLIEQKCLFCHEKQLDIDKEYEPEAWQLRRKPQQLCVGCHSSSPHLNALEHIQEVDDELFEKIREAEQNLALLLPLDGRRIQCITCHSPHQSGVLNKHNPAASQVADRTVDKGVGYIEHSWNQVFQQDKKKRLSEYARLHERPPILNYQKLQFEVLLRLSAKNGELCDVCHSFKK